MRAGLDGSTRQQFIQLAPGQHGQGAGHVDPAAARPDAGHMRDGLGARHHGIQQAQARQRLVGVGDEAVSAGFVAA